MRAAMPNSFVVVVVGLLLFCLSCLSRVYVRADNGGAVVQSVTIISQQLQIVYSFPTLNDVSFSFFMPNDVQEACVSSPFTNPNAPGCSSATYNNGCACGGRATGVVSAGYASSSAGAATYVLTISFDRTQVSCVNQQTGQSLLSILQAVNPGWQLSNMLFEETPAQAGTFSFIQDYGYTLTYGVEDGMHILSTWAAPVKFSSLLPVFANYNNQLGKPVFPPTIAVLGNLAVMAIWEWGYLCVYMSPTSTSSSGLNWASTKPMVIPTSGMSAAPVISYAANDDVLVHFVNGAGVLQFVQITPQAGSTPGVLNVLPGWYYIPYPAYTSGTLVMNSVTVLSYGGNMYYAYLAGSGAGGGGQSDWPICVARAAYGVAQFTSAQQVCSAARSNGLAPQLAVLNGVVYALYSYDRNYYVLGVMKTNGTAITSWTPANLPIDFSPTASASASFFSTPSGGLYVMYRPAQDAQSFHLYQCLACNPSSPSFTSLGTFGVNDGSNPFPLPIATFSSAPFVYQATNGLYMTGLDTSGNPLIAISSGGGTAAAGTNSILKEDLPLDNAQQAIALPDRETAMSLNIDDVNGTNNKKYMITLEVAVGGSVGLMLLCAAAITVFVYRRRAANKPVQANVETTKETPATTIAATPSTATTIESESVTVSSSFV